MMGSTSLDSIINTEFLKLHLISDLHLDTWGMQSPICDAHACAILGDVHEGLNGYDFVRRIADTKPVMLVLGNHEFYLSSLKDTYAAWEEKAKKHGNIFLLQNSTHQINDVRFIGATLWTDFGRNPLLMIQGMGVTKDFLYINNDEGDDLITAQFLLDEHEKSRAFIQQEVEKEFSGKTVVLTHHAPSYACVPEKYIGHQHNYMFCSDLDNIMAYNKIDFWAHGHMHTKTDTMLCETRLLCNPRGSNKYPNLDFDPNFVINI